MPNIFSNTDLVVKAGSVAELKTLDLAEGDLAETVSYYADWLGTGDMPKGGTMYLVVSQERYQAITGISTPDEYGDHTMDNGYIAMMRDRSVKNVLQFGAYGDGTREDTDQIQAALDLVDFEGGGKVYIPTGTYLVFPKESGYLWLTILSQRQNYGVLFMGSNTTVYGDGPGSLMKLGGTLDSDGLPNDGRGDFSTTHMFVNKGAPGLPRQPQEKDIKVLDLAFDGNWVAESGEGVSLVAVQNFQISNCTFRNTFYECSYLLFCRGGIWSNNFLNKGGRESGFLQDGGGPLVDASMGLIVINNVLSDSGYYAILAINAYDCEISNNYIIKDEYGYSSGFQGMRLAMCENCKVDRNVILESGFAGIWDHIGHNNRITNNTVIKCGYDSDGGAQIHGITVDTLADTYKGRSVISNNLCMVNFGAGIAILGAYTSGDDGVYFAGVNITDNLCLYNQRDGITVYGNFHNISSNIVESNGTLITDGIPGNGFSGIALNGSRYCMVTGNTCMDIPTLEPQPINLDGLLDPQNYVTPEFADHPSQTQNWGVRELIADFTDVDDITASASGTTITVTETGHSRTVGEVVHLYNADDTAYNGYYYVDTVVDADTWTYIVDVAPTNPTDTSIIVALEIKIADYNVITNNILAHNLNNPGLEPVVAGGYGQFTRAGIPELDCGLNSTTDNNIAQ